VFALTDVGHTRDHNEDTFLVAELEGAEPLLFDSDASRELRPGQHGALFLVADGMGGAASGELASSMAGKTVLDVLGDRWSNTPDVNPDVFATALRDATATANERIHQYARENPEHRGMGTTATIAGLLDDHVYVAQVGDSRAYLVRNGRAIQLTKDQSLMQRLVEAGEITQEEAEQSDRRNIILQALGPEPQITIDLTHQQLRRGDTLILCSDGLSGLVRADEIAKMATNTADVSALCRKLVARANELGGPDNITVVAVHVDGQRLHASKSDDRVGHMAFPLQGTLSDDDSTTGSSTFRSDPTPPFGYRMPSRETLDEEFANAENAEQASALGADAPLLDERKQRVAPILFLLGIAATVAAIWTIWRLLKKP
jgi:protein phosphatase